MQGASGGMDEYPAKMAGYSLFNGRNGLNDGLILLELEDKCLVRPFWFKNPAIFAG